MESCFCENGRGNVWKDYMERNMTEEDDWHHNIEDAVEGVRRCSTRCSVYAEMRWCRHGM